jgi:hypothetical protein
VRARVCPQCGEPLAAIGQSAPLIQPDVSMLWTFLFGCFYFLAKGWIKAGLVSLVIAVFTGGLSWFVIPFFAQQFVVSVEGWG